MEETNSKLVFNAGTARKLLKMGAHMIDIKPNHDNPVATVFVFEDTKDFQDKLGNIIENKKHAKEQDE